MEATAKVSLDSSEFEAGAKKVQRADAAMGASAKENFEKVGSSAAAAFNATTAGAEKVSRSYRELASEAQKAGRALEAANKVASTPLSSGTDAESQRLAAYFRKAEEMERAQKARQRDFKFGYTPEPPPPPIYRPWHPDVPPPLSMPSASVRVAEIARAGAKVAETAEGAVEGAAKVGISRMGQMELMHVVRSLGGSLLAGAPVGRAVEMESPRILEALGPAALKAAGGMEGLAAGLAALAIPVAAAAAAFDLYKADRDTNRLRRETSKIGENASNLGEDVISDYQRGLQDVKTLGRRASMRHHLARLNGPNATETEDTESEQDLDKDLEDAQEQVKKVRHYVRHRRHSIGDHLAGLFGGGVTDDLITDARAATISVRDRRDKVQERELGLKEREFEGDPTVELEKLGITRDEKQSQARNDQARGKINDGQRQIEYAQKEYDLGVKEYDRRRAEGQNALDLESKILSVRRVGRDVESESARVRVEAAKAALASGPTQGPEYERRKLAVAAAEEDQEQAARRDRERDNDAARRVLNSNLRGSADNVSYQRAVNDRDAIQNKLDDRGVKPEERQQLEAELAEANERIHNLVTNSYNKASEVEKLNTQADTGRGPDEQIKAIDRRLQGINTDRRTNKERNGDDALVNAQLNAESVGLKKQKGDIQFSEQQSLLAAKEHTREMTLQMHGLTQIASLESIRFSYQQQITAAMREGKTELAGQLQIQANIAEKQARMRAFANPGEGATQRATERGELRAERNYDLSGGLLNPQRSSGGDIQSGIDPVTGKYRAITPDERTAARAARRRSPFSGATLALEKNGQDDLIKDNADIPDNAGTPDRVLPSNFMARFHGVAEENRPKAPIEKTDPNAARIDKLTGQLEKQTAAIDRIAAKLAVAVPT